MNHSKYDNTLALTGRILMSVIFLFSGIGKIAAPAATMAHIASSGLPFPLVALAGAIAVEVGGGLLLVLGYNTRIVALAMAAFCIVTGIVFHGAGGDQNQLLNLLKNIAMAGGLLNIAALGGGGLSIDGKAAAQHA